MELNTFDLNILLGLAIRGYNAEIRYKSARPKNERDSERAMRRSKELEVIQTLRAELVPEKSPTNPLILKKRRAS